MVCDELDIPKYAMFAVPKKDMRIKDKADLLEAFIGALYVDKDLVKVSHFKYALSLFFIGPSSQIVFSWVPNTGLVQC